MHVFVTGASGFVGSAVVRHLVAAGHKASGLARSDASAEAVEKLGATVVRGDLEDLDALAKAAKAADAVIHCAFIHDFDNFAASIATDRRAVETFGAALEGSEKPFIVTSGIGVMAQGDLLNEEMGAASEGPAAARGATEAVVLAMKDKGVRSAVMRLPPSVHGDGDHGFVPMIIGTAREKGAAAYIGAGENRWPAVHREDAARAYVLAIEKGAAGARWHAIGDRGVPFRRIAEVIGRKLDLPVISVPKEEAMAHFGWMGGFAQLDIPASAAITEQTLGWKPNGVGLIEDLQNGTYLPA